MNFVSNRHFPDLFDYILFYLIDYKKYDTNTLLMGFVRPYLFIIMALVLKTHLL